MVLASWARIIAGIVATNKRNANRAAHFLSIFPPCWLPCGTDYHPCFNNRTVFCDYSANCGWLRRGIPADRRFQPILCLGLLVAFPSPLVMLRCPKPVNRQ